MSHNASKVVGYEKNPRSERETGLKEKQKGNNKFVKIKETGKSKQKWGTANAEIKQKMILRLKIPPEAHRLVLSKLPMVMYTKMA